MSLSRILQVAGIVTIIMLLPPKRRRFRPKSVPKDSETLIKYKCNYVELLGTDDQIRMFLIAVIKPEHKKNFIEATSDVLKRLSPSCYDGFINKNLTKEQATLLYATMNYFNVYFTLTDFDDFDQTVYDSKQNNLLNFLNLIKDQNFQNNYNKIVQNLAHERFYTIL